MTPTIRIEFQVHDLVANNQGLFFILFMQCLATN